MSPIQSSVHSILPSKAPVLTVTQGMFLLKSDTQLLDTSHVYPLCFVPFGTDDNFFPWLSLYAFPDFIFLLYISLLNHLHIRLLFCQLGVFDFIAKYTKSKLISRTYNCFIIQPLGFCLMPFPDTLSYANNCFILFFLLRTG